VVYLWSEGAGGFNPYSLINEGVLKVFSFFSPYIITFQAASP